jgi:hypothetical protein
MLEEQPTGGTVETDRTVRLPFTGFVSGDTITFRDAGLARVFRFVLEDPAVPVRVNPDGSPANEVWSRR